jgi:Tfp pilus assembly protein PilX
MLRVQHRSRHDARSEQGYAMVVASIISVVMFSLLGVYMTMTNLSKSSTNAYVDGTNTFYVAESGLNRRAEELRKKFVEQQTPSTNAGIAPALISECFPILTTATTTKNDFECRNYPFGSASNFATLTSSSNNNAIGGTSIVTNSNDRTNYTAYTFVADRTDYKLGSSKEVIPTLIPAGQVYAGLNALEYKYTVYSTAKKPSSVKLVASTADATEIAAKAKIGKTSVTPIEEALAAAYDAKKAVADAKNSRNAADSSSTNTVLQMDFKTRIIPLFQFAAFYEDDLEINSQMPMVVSGRVHTNGHLMAISYGYGNNGTVGHKPTTANLAPADVNAGTRILGQVTAVGRIFDRVFPSLWRPSVCGGSATAEVYCGPMAVYIGSAADPSLDLDPTHYAYFPDAASSTRVTPLSTAELAPFGEKMKDGTTGVKRLNPPKAGFLREKNYKTLETGEYYGKADMRLKFYPGRTIGIPFSFSSIQNGSGCDLTGMNISVDRQGRSTLACTTFSKGQLQSLRQPVMPVDTKVATGDDAATIQKKNILRALQISIVSNPTPLTLYDMNKRIISTATWTTTFDNLLTTVGVSSLDRATLLTKTPSQILVDKAGVGNVFLPAPIQLVNSTTDTVPSPLPSPLPTTTPLTTSDDYNGGFFNQLKGVWMQMLQTNIKSLTYWNRYNVYVNPTVGVADLTTAYVRPTLTISSGNTTDELAFKRKAAEGSDSWRFLAKGLAAADRTENGLVLHATVSDDTDGNGSLDISDANGDVPGKDVDGLPITGGVDKYRKYPIPNSAAIRKSPYGFVFSGGEELPGPLTIATDQAAYIQGDYNNPVNPVNSAMDLDPALDRRTGKIPSTFAYKPLDTSISSPGFYREPAAFMADTITVLSNGCSNNNKQVNCGKTNSIGTINVTNGVAINAAFLSNLMKSQVKIGSDVVVPMEPYTSFGTLPKGGVAKAGVPTPSIDNGGLNKFMRLLENWAGSAPIPKAHFNYTGSMVSLGEPLESDELPSGSGVPNRNFNYETRFNALDGLPPLTPKAMYLQQDVFHRKY